MPCYDGRERAMSSPEVGIPPLVFSVMKEKLYLSTSHLCYVLRILEKYEPTVYETLLSNDLEKWHDEHKLNDRLNKESSSERS